MIDLDQLDTSVLQYPIEEVRKYNPQRFEFEQLSGVYKICPEQRMGVGYRDLGTDEYWTRGHIPGRPLFPGVLMLEAGAQLACFTYKILYNDDPNRFLGFGGVEKVRFRATVQPGERMIFIAKEIESRRRRFTFDVQGVVGGRLVFEAQIIGMVV